MKYGAKALRRAVATDNTAIIEDLAKLPTNFEFHPTDPISSFSMKNAVQHLQEITSSTIITSSFITELLYSYGSVGLMIQLFRSEASNINPWSIQVTYVSSDRSDTASAMCALDSGVKVKDSLGNVAADVLIVANPMNPQPYLAFTQTLLHQKYLAVAFTRNPDLNILTLHILQFTWCRYCRTTNCSSHCSFYQSHHATVRSSV
jgi:hypothetical protein